MGLLSRLLPDPETRARVGTDTATFASSAGWLEDLLGGGAISTAGQRVNANNAMTVGALFAAIRMLAQSVGQLPIHIYRRGAEGQRERLHTHPLRALLNDAPNEWQTAMEYRALQICWAILRGNAVSWLKLRKNLDIEEIIPLEPERMTYWLTPDGQKLVYEYRHRDGRSEFIPRIEVLHVRAPLGNRWLGLGLLDVARDTIGLSMVADEHAARFYENAAAPAGVLTSPKPLSDSAWTKLKQRWEGRHKGAANAWRTALLEDGVKWEPLGLNLKDQQFLETRTFQVQEIARLVGIPPHLIGELSRSTNNNIEAQGLELVRYGLAAWCTLVEQRIKLDCFGMGERRNLYVKHALEAFTRGELLNRYRSYQIGRMGGWLNVNEIREMEDRNGIGPDGETYLAPLNMVPASLFGEPNGTDETDEPPPTSGTPGTQPGGLAPSPEDQRHQVQAAITRSAQLVAPVMMDVAARVHRRAEGERERRDGGAQSALAFLAWTGQAVEPVLRSMALQLDVPPDVLEDAVSAARDAVAAAWTRAPHDHTPDEYARRGLRLAARTLFAHTLAPVEV